MNGNKMLKSVPDILLIARNCFIITTSLYLKLHIRTSVTCLIDKTRAQKSVSIKG